MAHPCQLQTDATARPQAAAATVRHALELSAAAPESLRLESIASQESCPERSGQQTTSPKQAQSSIAARSGLEAARPGVLAAHQELRRQRLRSEPPRVQRTVP